MHIMLPFGVVKVIVTRRLTVETVAVATSESPARTFRGREACESWNRTSSRWDELETRRMRPLRVRVELPPATSRGRKRNYSSWNHSPSAHIEPG